MIRIVQRYIHGIHSEPENECEIESVGTLTCGFLFSDEEIGQILGGN